MVSCIRILAAWLPIRTQSAPAATQDSAIATKDPEPATKDPEPATEDLEPATEDLKPATEDLEPATEDPEPEGPLPEYEIANHLAHPHRALQMEDILHYVFEEVLLSVPYWDKFNGARENKATLARAARACKAFTKPALSVLWRDIENLVPLFRILSCVHTQDGTRQDQYFIRGPIDPTEWGRFQMYAQWPRKVACLSHFEKLHPSVFAGLSRYNNDKPLLSGLHTLSWRLKHPYNIVPIFALVPPSLCSLNITFATSNTTSETQQERRSSLDLLLRGLHARTSHLELLEIDGHADTTMLIAIGKLDSLRRVSMTGFGTPPVLQTQGILALAAMSNLTELNLPIEMEESRTAPELAVPVEFAQLQKLSVQGAPAHLSDFLARITSPQLTALNLRLTSCRRTSECQDLLRAVSQYWGPMLKEVHVVASHFRGGEDTAEALTSIIEPTLGMHQLRNVLIYLRDWYTIAFTDEDLGKMAKSWPRLQCLTIIYEQAVTSRPSLRSLEYLARDCPDLVYVTLPDIDCSLRGVADVTQYDHHLNSVRITYFRNVGKDSDASAVARVLHRLFPHIDYKAYLHTQRFNDVWAHVIKRYAELYEARSDTRTSI